MKKRSTSSPKHGPSAFLSRTHRTERDSSRGAPELAPRILAEVSLANIRSNYDAVAAQVKGLSLLPMVKADAYGHGLKPVAQALAQKPGLYGLGVATLEEGARVREAIGPKSRQLPVLVFSALSPWSEDKGAYCEHHHLTAVLASEEDWNQFCRGSWFKRIPYELKFNTGMNRLGIPSALAPRIAQSVRAMDPEHRPQGVLSHLAIAESPDSSLTRRQVEEFRSLRAPFSSAAPAAHFHLANSAAIWNQKLYGLTDWTDVVRPGLALYGVSPWSGAPTRGLQPAMTLWTEVLLVHCLKVGDTVGYGGAYRVTQAGERIAIVAGGYGDGVKRSLGDQGHAWLYPKGNPTGGAATRFVGRVSMDLSALRVHAQTQPGDRVELIGPHVDPWAQAEAAGTIPYELLTSVTGRVQRKYDGDAG